MKPDQRLSKLKNFEPYVPSGSASESSDYSVDELNEPPLSDGARWVSWTCRCIAAAIMLETLWFKFTGHPESVYIFTKMNMESWWRYGQGVWELIASALLLWPRTVWLGSLLTLAAMGAAILSHMAILGIAIGNDHGVLFGMACATFLCSLTALWIHQASIPNIVRLDD